MVCKDVSQGVMFRALESAYSVFETLLTVVSPRRPMIFDGPIAAFATVVDELPRVTTV